MATTKAQRNARLEKRTEFNEFRFNGLDFVTKKDASVGQILEVERANKKTDKCVVEFDCDQVFKTKYGFAVILDKNHVVFVRNWQVGGGKNGVSVVFDKKYYTVKEFGNFENYSVKENLETFDDMKKIAFDQQEKCGYAGFVDANLEIW